MYEQIASPPRLQILLLPPAAALRRLPFAPLCRHPVLLLLLPLLLLLLLLLILLLLLVVNCSPTYFTNITFVFKKKTQRCVFSFWLC